VVKLIKSVKEDALVLSQYFHDIGVFLHFQEDALLKNILFLKPNWATNAVYKILDHPLLNKNYGRFNKEQAKTIWSEDEYLFVRDELLRLMQKFFLTYQIGKSGEYIVPERLKPSPPLHKWVANNFLFMRYKYDFFMPKGIMSQLTVQMHRYITDHNLVWKRGVILKREGTTAEIVESYDDRTIKIRIAGKNRRDFMTIITEELDAINFQYEKMKFEKLIPCNCSVCGKTSNPHFYILKELKLRLEKRRDVVECGNSYQMVNVQSMIEEVFTQRLEEKFRQTGTRSHSFHPRDSQRDKVFVCYSHKDKQQWLEKVQTHLKVLESEGLSIYEWDDTKIQAGMKWRQEIETALLHSKAAVLLVSSDFLASDFISEEELPSLLRVAEQDGVTILPIILKPCRYTKNKHLAEFKAVNNPENPLSKLTENEQDEILVQLSNQIAELYTNESN